MRKSRAITLTVLSALMLTACCVTMPGCRRGAASAPAPDHTWYDASGNPVAEKWKTDEQGNRVLDAEGRPIPDPHPHDRYGRPWAYQNNVLMPLSPIGYSSSHSSSTWLWGGSGYRSTSGGSYHPVGGSSTSHSSTPSSISRGGFGSTGSGGGS